MRWRNASQPTVRSVDELPVLPAFGQHDVQQAERERGVRARHRREVPVALRRGARPNRIDGDDQRAVLPRLEDRPPQVGMRRQHVRAPEHDELREPERLRVHSDAVVAQRVAGAESARDRADRHDVTRRAQHVPEPASRAVDALDQPHAAGADEGPDRLGAVLRDHVPEPRRDPLERLVPRDPGELAAPLRPDAAHRIQQAVGRARVRQVVRDLVAQRSAGVGVVGIAAKRDRLRLPSRSRSNCTCRGNRADTRRGHHGFRDRASSSITREPAIRGRRLIVGRRVKISTVVFAIKWLTLSGSACSLLPSRIADRLGRGRSRT